MTPAAPVAAALASIPSPPFDSIDLGPLHLNVYGLMIALGVIVAVWVFGRRLEERGVGDADDASAIAIWAVLAGVIGARLYHVATDWERFAGDLQRIPAIWEGGLGIPGGLGLGIPVGLWMARRRGIALSTAATCAAPGIPFAQAIGRLGNWFNQELYGRPSDLPWALRIDADHLVVDPETGERFAVGTTFHPTFLYEGLWNVGVGVVLLWVDRRFRPGGGALMGLFVALYGVGRFWVEGLRVDPADHLGPLRWNQWVALAMVVGGLAAFAVLRRRPEPAPAAGGPAVDGDPAQDPGEDAEDDLAGDPTDRSVDDVDPGGDPDGDPDLDGGLDGDRVERADGRDAGAGRA